MKRLFTPLLISLLLAAPVSAQDIPIPAPGGNPFEPVLIVNDRVISRYEFEQRALFLTILRAPGDPAKEAMRALIEDRLRIEQAKRFDFEATAEDIDKGMAEFASRAQMTTEQFVEALGQAGVAAETFRDFVAAGVVWREMVRAKYGIFANVSEAEIDRAIEADTRRKALRVLLSELVIPAAPGEELQVLELARQIRANVSTEGGFAAAVAQHSAAGSRDNGGRLDWMPLSNLPPAVAPYVLALAPGEVSEPLAVPGAVALFQLRGLEEMPPETPVAVSVDYTAVTLPAGEAGAVLLAQLQARVDICSDLWAVLGEENQALGSRQTQAMAEVPADLGLAIARLDQYETTVVPRAGQQVFVQLCQRTPVPPEGGAINRASVRDTLVNQQLAERSDLWLKELRANAIIRQP